MSIKEQIKSLSRQNLLVQYVYRRWGSALTGRCADTDELIIPSLRMRTSIDVGANAGAYAQLLARTSDLLVCFEPVPFMIRLLNMLFRGQSHVHIQAVALSDTSGTARLSIPLRKSEAVSALASLKQTFEDAEIIEVETLRFDDFRTRNPWADAAPIDFIKIDVEGFEVQVLEGMQETIASMHPVFLIETEVRHNGESLQVFQRLAEQGYSTYISRIGGSLEAVSITRTEDILAMQSLDDLAQESFNYRIGSERRYLNNFWFIHADSHLSEQLKPFIRNA